MRDIRQKEYDDEVSNQIFYGKSSSGPVIEENVLSIDSIYNPLIP